MKYKFFILLFLIACTGFYACKDDNQTYTEELKAEQDLIKSFLTRQKITVVTTMPNTFPWPENVYYKSTTGLYFRLTNLGDTATQEVEGGDLVITRYIQYTLEEQADTIYNLSTIDNPYPTTFKYLDLTTVCSGWHQAVGYMMHHNAEAKLIVYSKIGFSTYNRPATPIGYDLKIKIQKN
jgi:hypothetical protein